MPLVLCWFIFVTTKLKHDQGKHVFDSSKTTYSKELRLQETNTQQRGFTKIIN